MYHPAAALRASSLKRTMIEDMSGLPQVLIDSRARRGGSPIETVAPAPSISAPTPTPEPEPEPEVEPEAIVAAIAIAPEPDGTTAPEPVDENQMALF
jgi:hypothetical protein